MRLTVVVPTITGREESLARTTAAYSETLAGQSYELVVIKDQPSWPAACNRGFEKARGDIIHFTADDLEPLPGWWEATEQRLAGHDELPAPKVVNFAAAGPWDNWMDGPDGALTHFTRIPIMTRSQYEQIGPWPEQLHYEADVWVSERARVLGIETRMLHAYCFVHHWSQIGRVDTPEVLADAANQMNLLRAEGLKRCD